MQARNRAVLILHHFEFVLVRQSPSMREADDDAELGPMSAIVAVILFWDFSVPRPASKCAVGGGREICETFVREER